MTYNSIATPLNFKQLVQVLYMFNHSLKLSLRNESKIPAYLFNRCTSKLELESFGVLIGAYNSYLHYSIYYWSESPPISIS